MNYRKAVYSVNKFSFIVFILAIIVCSVQLKILMKGTNFAKEQFIFVNGNYEKIRNLNVITYTVNEAKSIAENNAHFEMSPSRWNYFRVKSKYILYPTLLSPDWSYYIDFENKFKPPDDSWKSRKLATGIMVYAKPGHDFTTASRKDFIDHYPVFNNLLIFLFASFLNILIGILILSMLKISCDETGSLFFLSTSYLAGFICLTFGLWIFLVLGGTLSRPVIVCNFIVIFVLIFSVNSRESIKNFIGCFYPKNIIGILPNRFWSIPLCFISLFFLSCILFLTISLPVWDWDSMSHWILKSKVIFHHKTLNFHYTHHNDYPILWPLNIAIQFVLLGGSYDEMAKWTAALLYLCFISQLISGLRILKIDRNLTWLIILLFISCFTYRPVYTGYAENGYFAFMAGCFSSMLLWLQHPQKRGYLFLGILMGFGLATVKIEGAVASLIIGLSILLLREGPITRDRKTICIGFLLSFLTTLFWIIWVKTHGFLPKFSHQFHAEFSWDKIFLTFKMLFKSIYFYFDLSAFCFIIIIIFLKLLLLPYKKNNQVRFLNWASVGLIVFTVIGIYFAWEKTMIRSEIYSIARYFLHITPPLALLLGYHLQELLKLNHT